MKNIKYILSALLISASLVLSIGQIPEYSKVYGHPLNDIPTKIIELDKSIIVLGHRTNQSNYIPFVVAYDSNGDVIWEVEYDQDAKFNDAAIDKRNNAVMIVGHTEPWGATFINQCILLSLNISDGSTRFIKHFQLDGRQGMGNIICHSKPADPDFPFFISGVNNPKNNAPSAHDISFIVNVGHQGDVKWYREVIPDPRSSSELEIGRGLFEKDKGVIMVGNDIPDNDGVFVFVDENGEIENSSCINCKNVFYAFGRIDYLDGLQMQRPISSSADIMLVGQNFDKKQGIIHVLDGSFPPQILYGIVIPSIEIISEIHQTASGDYYAVGIDQSNGAVIMKIKDTGSQLLLERVRYFNQDVLFQSDPHVYPVYDEKAILFTLSSYEPDSHFGELDIVHSSLSLNLDNPCFRDSMFLVQPYVVPIDHQRAGLGSDRMIPVSTGSLSGMSMKNRPSCGMQSSCSADFSFDANGCEIYLFGEAMGIPPYTFQWDIDCDGTIDSNDPNPVLNWNCHGLREVCLIVTDSIGCVAEIAKNVSSNDRKPPKLDCPPNASLSTLPGLCYANYPAVPIVTDDCDPMPTWMCVLSGATVGTQLNTNYNVGTTLVTCYAEDCAGNVDSCSYEVTVQDNEAPSIVCGSVGPITRPACIPESIPIPSPVVSDNCGIQFSGCRVPQDLEFPCGVTDVLCTTTDINGNRASCTFPVEVICECGDILESKISCSGKNIWDFCIYIANQTGASDNNCTVTLNSLQPEIMVSGGVVWDNGIGKITGTIISGASIPNPFQIQVTLNCDCGGNPAASCTFNVPLIPPCCDSIWVSDTAICSTDEVATIGLNASFALNDVLETTWYISEAPCSSPNWIAYQTTPGYSDLIIYPEYHEGDLCIAATVIRGEGSGGCFGMSTEMATVKLCAPINSTILDQEHCFYNQPVLPDPLVFSPAEDERDCIIGYQWYQEINGQKGVISGATDSIYQPPPLFIDPSPGPCSVEFKYYLEVENLCGISTGVSTITLYDNNAPDGIIYMDPIEDQPFCPGEDATLWYSPECSGEPQKWNWHESHDGVSWSPTQNGSISPKFNTNQLFQDTWYTVVDQNGVCPEDSQDFYIEVVDEIEVLSFTASLDDVCVPSSLSLDLDANIDPELAPLGCDYVVEWYRGYDLLETTVTNTFPISRHILTGPFGGNYYALVYSSCCPEMKVISPVRSIDPTMQLDLLVPCLVCKDDEAILQAVVSNQTQGGPCTYRWEKNGVELFGRNSDTLVITEEARYRVFVTCNDCELSTDFELKICWPTSTITDIMDLAIRILENPAQDNIIIEMVKSVSQQYKYQVFHLRGEATAISGTWNSDSRLKIDIAELPPGTYLILIGNDQQGGIAKFVKI